MNFWIPRPVEWCLRTLRGVIAWIGHKCASYLSASMDINELYTKKVFLLAKYKEFAEKLELGRYKHQDLSPAVAWISSHRSVRLRPKNMVSLGQLVLSPNTPFKGKLFLCRTICQSIKMWSVLTVVEIPQEDMADRGVFLSLCNYQYPYEDEKSALPTFSPGTILVIKNPVFDCASSEPLCSVRSDNPTDVTVLTQCEFEKYFPGYKWPSGDMENDEDLLVRPARCKGKGTIKDWMVIGHLRLNKKNYVGAIKAYSMVIKYNPEDLQALCRRCSLHLYLKVYQKSLEDSTTILNRSPCHKKAIRYKASSLIGLRKYSIAIEFLTCHINKKRYQGNSPQKAKLMELLLKAMTWRKQERCGDYDIEKMLSFPAAHVHDCANYLGNVAIKYIEGRGLGLVVTKDIKCGDLIIAEKAFAISFADKEGDERWIYDRENDKCQRASELNLIVAIAHRLIRNPELSKDIYQLYDGTCRTSVETIADPVDDGVVDFRRISSICRFNAFSGDNRIDRGDSEHDGPAGLWLTPSYINNSCSDANSRWKVIGDFIFIRACRTIFKSEEITVPYVNCSMPYDLRYYSFLDYGFTCDCTACLLDSQDDKIVHSRRQKILSKLYVLDMADGHTLEQMTLIEELFSLRRNYPHLNPYTLCPLMNLTEKYMEMEDYAVAADLAARVYKLASVMCINQVTLQCCCDAMWCYIKYKNIKKAKMCGVALKACLIQDYGYYSEEILKIGSPELVEAMAENNIVL